MDDDTKVLRSVDFPVVAAIERPCAAVSLAVWIGGRMLVERTVGNGARSPEALRWADVAGVVEELSRTCDLVAMTEVLRRSARRIVGADGIAIVLREGEECYYVAEDAREPLWLGRRFPCETCISGWAMRHVETVVVPDIRHDPRVPAAAYAATFVRSLVVVPIGHGVPVAALGAYWSEARMPLETEVAMLEMLARGAATGIAHGSIVVALERANTELRASVADRIAELERLGTGLRQARKMEVFGRLAGNVVHDFNNLLVPIVTGLDLVLASAQKQGQVGANAVIAMTAAEKAQRLVQRFLAFAGSQPLLTSAVDLPALIEGLRSLLQSAIGSRIALVVAMEDDLPAVHADSEQLEMALLNLAVNARDAMPDGGTLRIAARRGADHPDRHPTPPGSVLLSIADDGVGMDIATLASARDAFFTTKAPGKGTGLGLAMVDDLAAQLGGTLDIISHPGAGTEIRICLPIAAQTMPGRADRPDAGMKADTGSGTVLLIDDDALVRLTTGEMLRELQFHVVEAEGAAEGMAMLDEGLRPDLVVTDYLMPGMTGTELAAKLRTDHPGIAVLIVSGYEGPDMDAGDVTRLAKPFRRTQLAAGIAAARDRLTAGRPI